MNVVCGKRLGSATDMKCHRRRGNFLPGEGGGGGGGGKPFAKENLAKRRHMKVARYSFSGSIPMFEHKLRRHRQTFGKIATTVVLRWKFVMIGFAMTSELS